jgi:protein-histidine pros-kinase
MARRIRPDALLIAGSLLWGILFAVMSAIGLWILRQAAMGQLHLTRPEAIVILIALGFAGMIFCAFYYHLGKRNLELEAREREHAAELEVAVRSLQDSDYKFRSIIQYTDDIIYIKDLEGRFLLMNPAGGRLFGRPPEELAGKRDSDFLAPEFACRMREHEREVLTAKAPLTRVERAVLRDGSEHVFHTTKYPYPSPEGEVIGIIGISRDVSELNRAEEALRASEARFRGIMEAAPDAMFLVNRAGDVVMANAQAEKMFGYDRAELLGMGVEQLMPERFRAEHVAHRRDYYANPYPRSMGLGMDLYGLRPDGSEFPVEISLSPLETPEGMLVIASIRDVTERKHTLEEMAQRTAELKKSRELNQLKDHFLSSLSHEMKTPLSLIFGYAELLEEKYPEEELLKGILDGSRRLNEHISNMLDYSAMVSGTLSLYKTEVNLGEVIQGVHASLEEALRLKRIRFLSEVDPETPAIQADARRISQVLEELLDNAMKFTPEDGALGVRVRPEPSMVVIEVWDTGPGIEAPEQQQIWEAFTQLDVGDAFRKGGLGLGLTLVKRLTELHGGYVELASEVGKGSHFTVRLPIEPPPAEPQAPAAVA